jgi:hypothetical protein
MTDQDKELKELRQTVREQADDLIHTRFQAINLQVDGCQYRRKIMALELQVQQLQGLIRECQRNSMQARIGVPHLRGDEPTGLTSARANSRRRAG